MIRSIGGACVAFLMILFIANIQLSRYHVNHSHAEQDCKHYCHNLPEPWLCSFFRDTLKEADTFWTAVASLVGLIALWGIYEQIVGTQHANEVANRSAKAAEDATNETKRSIDQFIRAERGMLHIQSLRVIEREDDGRELHFVMENVGRSPLEIVREWIVDSYLPPGPQNIPFISWPFEFSAPMSQPIPSGRQISAGGVADIGVERRIPFALQPIPPNSGWMVIRMVFQYRTMGREYFGGFSFAADVDAAWMIRVPNQGNTFDVPIDFDFSKRP